MFARFTDDVREPLDQRKRILLLSPAFPPSAGGIERTAAELAARLTDYELEVVSGRPTSSVGMRGPAAVKVHWASNDPPYGRRATLALARLTIRVGIRFRPDLVLALHIRMMPAARALARLLGARSILVVHAKEVLEQPALARAAVRWADAVVTVSEFSRELALGAGADGERIRIIHPGVMSPPPPLPLASRPSPPTIITVARMSDPHKGHDVALRSMARVRTRLPDARWVMVGEGTLRDELRAAAKRRGLDGCISFPGAVDDDELGERLSSAHAFCLLSRQPPGAAAGEGFGIAFVEAGAHGLPVVAGAVPGVIDAVEDDVSGILVDPSDPDAIADALERVMLDLQLAQRLAEGGRRRARELQWDAVVERHRGLIADVLAAPPRGRAGHELAWLRDLAVGPRGAL
jgi:phosphatidylinositol alpha-1,6-mannosyltransferase